MWNMPEPDEFDIIYLESRQWPDDFETSQQLRRPIYNLLYCIMYDLLRQRSGEGRALGDSKSVTAVGSGLLVTHPTDTPPYSTRPEICGLGRSVNCYRPCGIGYRPTLNTDETRRPTVETEKIYDRCYICCTIYDRQTVYEYCG